MLFFPFHNAKIFAHSVQQCETLLLDYYHEVRKPVTSKSRLDGIRCDISLDG
jgi:hypothetical protein